MIKIISEFSRVAGDLGNAQNQMKYIIFGSMERSKSQK